MPTLAHTCIHTTATEEAPCSPTQEGMMTLIIASKQDGHAVPILSSPIKLPDSFIVLMFNNFLSSVIGSASGSCCSGMERLGKWQVLT